MTQNELNTANADSRPYLVVQGVVLQLVGLHIIPAIPELPVRQRIALEWLASLKNLQQHTALNS